MYIYDPAKVPPSELPIASRARSQDKSWSLWNIPDAKTFCQKLLGMRNTTPFDFTWEEWKSIASVADGGIWPVPDHPYTNDDWHRDGQFSAAAGQEVTEEIYNDMLDVLPPFDLPRCNRTDGCTCGFLVSEPICHDYHTGKGMYNAFGKRGGKYYYLGLLPCRPGDEY